MGSRCSTHPTKNSVDIVGHALKLVMQEYRSELILMQFTSVSLVVILILLFIRCLTPRFIAVNEIQSTDEEYKAKVKKDIVKFKMHFKELDRALEEIENILTSNNCTLVSLAQSLAYIENLHSLVRTSPHLLSIVISKLINKNYAGLCMAILQLENANPCRCHKSWQAITCTLCGLCYYTEASPRLCLTAINAGIIPLFASVLSQKSYLDDLDRNPPIMFLFQMASRIFHNIAQIEKLKYNLEKHNCCEILLNVITHTNNRLLRAISLLTAAQITRNGIHKVSFTNDDSSILFRLYFESVNSRSHEAYGLKQEHLLNGFYAIGQLDCLSYGSLHY